MGLDIVIGHEADAMTRSPAVARVSVKGTTPEGQTVSADAAPGGDLDFGNVDGSLAYQFEVTGTDGQGNTVMRGRSLGGIVLNDLVGATLPIFAQRLGEWARPPGTLAHAHVNAPAVPLGERYLFTTGGTGAQNATAGEEYDLFAWAGVYGQTFPFAVSTMGVNDTAVLGVGSDVAWWDGTNFSAPNLPDGLPSLDGVAGGSVVNAPDGRMFVIGATRPDKDRATDLVMEVASDGSLVMTARHLVFARAGASATWLPNVGLVVVGGSDKAPAVEVLPEKGTDFAVHNFPPDPTMGAGAAYAKSVGQLLLVGGSNGGAPAKTRLLDATCVSNCAMKDLPEATPDATLTRVSAFALTSTPQVIAVGDDLDPKGQTRTFLVDYVNLKVTELPLKEPRRGATALGAPNGTLALMGGLHPDGTEALTVEMYFPE